MRANSSESGTGHRGDGAVERLLEAETGLDADGEQVEDVGELLLELVLALLDPAVEPGVGAEEERGDREGGDDQLDMPSRPSGFTTNTKMSTGSTAAAVSTLMARKRSTASALPTPAQTNLRADVVDVARRGEPRPMR